MLLPSVAAALCENSDGKTQSPQSSVAMMPSLPPPPPHQLQLIRPQERVDRDEQQQGQQEDQKQHDD